MHMKHTTPTKTAPPTPQPAGKVLATAAAGGPARLEEALGLSTGHISPRGSEARKSFAVEVAVGGAVLSVKGRKTADSPPPPESSRGLVSTLSKGSRKRLLRKLAGIDHAKLKCKPLFLTFTYPAEWPGDPKRWKRDLDTMCKRIRRRFPKSSIVWKLEPQKRGAPHYHVLLFNVPWVDRQWLAQAWYEVVGSNDPKHLAAGTEVRAVRSWRGVLSYAAKYVAKVETDLPPGWENVGRIWGIRGVKHLPITIVRFVVGHREFFIVRRWLRHLLKARGFRVRHICRDDGLTAFADWGDIVKLLRLAFFEVRG